MASSRPVSPRADRLAPKIETVIAIDIAGELHVAHHLVDRAIGRGGVRAEAVDEAEQHQFGQRHHDHAERGRECRCAAPCRSSAPSSRMRAQKCRVRRQRMIACGADRRRATSSVSSGGYRRGPGRRWRPRAAAGRTSRAIRSRRQASGRRRSTTPAPAAASRVSPTPRIIAVIRMKTKVERHRQHHDRARRRWPGRGCPAAWRARSSVAG